MEDITRQEEIIRILKKEKVIRTSNLAKIFSVSEETIRRDMIRLEKIAPLKRVYGGAILDNLRGIEISISDRENKNIKEKQAIGYTASKLVNDNETIVLNSGTTVVEVAHNLQYKKNLTIITNSMQVAIILCQNPTFKIFLVGGQLRRLEMTTSGHLGYDFLSHFCADKAILGVGGIDIENGITDYHTEEAYIWHNMIKISNKSIIVADYSKFGIGTLNKICDISQIDYIVTDWNTPSKDISAFRTDGVEIIVAQKH